MTRLQGERIYPNADGVLEFTTYGQYGLAVTGTWWIRPPRSDAGPVLEHTVTENADGTITIEPSILSDDWRGYLESGIWREA